MRYRRHAPLLLLVAALALVLLPIAFGRSLWLKDIVQYTYPQKLYLRQRLLSGELPLWWREVGLGRPFYAMLQPGVLYPLNVLLLLPSPFSLDLFTVVHLFVIALGMRLWLRRLGTTELAAVAGALMLALSGYVLSQMATSGFYVYSIAWVPWMLAVGARPTTSRREQLQQAGRLALVSSLALSAGDPQAVFFGYLALGAQALAAGSRRDVVQALGTVAVAGALAALVGAMLLLPAAQVAAVGRPGGASIEDAKHFALHPARLLELVWPGAFGEPYSSSWFIGPLVDEGTGRAYTPFATTIYLGLATPSLALFACLRRDRRRLDVALAVLGLVALVVALGEHAPVWRAFFRFFPGAKMFRIPEKYVFVASVCLAALAARGLDGVVAAPKRALPVAALLLGVLVVAAVVTRVQGAAVMSALVGRFTVVTPRQAGEVLASRALAAVPVAAAFVVALAVAARGRFSPSTLPWLMTLLIGFDLLAANLRIVGWAPSSIYTRTPPLADEVRALAGTRLAETRLYRPLTLDLTDGGDKAWGTRATLVPNCGTELGITQLDAYDPFHTDRETELWTRLRAQPLKLLQLTATRLALLGDAQLGPFHPGLVVARSHPELAASLVEVQGAAPLVYLAERTIPVGDASRAAARVAEPDFVPGRDAVVEGGEAREARGSCTLAAALAESLAFDCEASAPAYAVVADAFFPGWSARVDGRPQPIVPANVAMQAVPLPAGRSHVELRYRPGGLVGGMFVTLLGLALAVTLSLRRRRPE